MEACLCSFPASVKSPNVPLNSQFLPRFPAVALSRRRTPPSRPAVAVPVQAALSRAKKEETIERVREQLENCYLLAGISYKGFTVKNFQDLRRSLPESVKLMVAKNTLVGKAVEGTPWEAVKPCMQGMTAWMFVHTDEITQALKPFREFQKETKLEDNDFTGAVFEGKFYAPDEFKALETMPSRAEVYAKLLGALQGPALSLVSTLQVPSRDLVLVLKAYVKKLEDEQAAGGVAAT